MIAASRRIVWWAAVAVAAIGCTAAMYPGPQRPDSELATIEAADTKIVEIDGQRVPHATSRYRILPGEHSVTVTLRAFRPGAGEMYLSKAHLAVCFTAHQGRLYRVVPGSGGGAWWPEIIDGDTTMRISARRVQRGTVGCGAGRAAELPPDDDEAAAPHRVGMTRGR
jgi:hypothetical protein